MTDRIPHGTNMHAFMEAPQIVPKKRMTIRSAKAKGKSLQNKVVAKLLEAFPTLEPDDIRSTMMSGGGEDVQLSPAARRLIPLGIECKKHAAFSVYTHYDQARTHGGHQPLLVIEADRRKPLAIVDLDYFIGLLKLTAPDYFS